MLYTEVPSFANIKITMKTLLGTEVCILYWRDYVKSGCAIAGFHCIQISAEMVFFCHVTRRLLHCATIADMLYMNLDFHRRDALYKT